MAPRAEPAVPAAPSWMARLEHASPAWLRVLPVSVICVLLLALLVVPLQMGRGREDLRTQLGDAVSPAQAALLDVQVAHASELAAIRGFLAVGDTAFLVRFHEEREHEAKAWRTLEARAAQIGPTVHEPVEEMRRRARLWRATMMELASGRDTGETLLDEIAEGEARYREVLKAAEAVNAALLQTDQRLRERIRAMERRETRLIVLLSGLALAVAVTVGWLSFRLSRVTGALRERVESERRARAEAEEALRTRDQVLRIVSHDLKNPLHTIGMSAQLLAEDGLPAEARAAQVGVIIRTVRRADRMVRDLLDAARLQTGHALAVSPEPVAVHTLLDEAVEALRGQARERGQALECAPRPGTRRVLADRDRVLQVFSNLIGNAVKFTPDGGTVVVREEADADGWVRFSVQDTGPGIAEEDVPNLFRPFWQARDTASLGSGLGLSIARGIVEAHGGRMEVRSRPGAGSTFSFTLPAAE